MTRPPEPLKDRLATIIQRGHVEQRTSEEVAEMVMLECYADSRNNPKDWFPHEVLRGLVAAGLVEMEKDTARLDWLDAEAFKTYPVAAMVVKAGWDCKSSQLANCAGTARQAIDAAMSAAAKDAK